MDEIALKPVTRANPWKPRLTNGNHRDFIMVLVLPLLCTVPGIVLFRLLFGNHYRKSPGLETFAVGYAWGCLTAGQLFFGCRLMGFQPAPALFWGMVERSPYAASLESAHDLAGGALHIADHRCGPCLVAGSGGSCRHATIEAHPAQAAAAIEGQGAPTRVWDRHRNSRSVRYRTHGEHSHPAMSVPALERL